MDKVGILIIIKVFNITIGSISFKTRSSAEKAIDIIEAYRI